MTSLTTSLTGTPPPAIVQGAAPIAPVVSDSFAASMIELRHCRACAKRFISAEGVSGHRKRALSIVISGGGPAGLWRGINALKDGHCTTILEKRSESCRGRENLVILKRAAYFELHAYGIYQYLLEQGLIFPAKDEIFAVRLTDLEQAMKCVIAEITQESVIQYDSQLEEIVSHGEDKVDLIYRQCDKLMRLPAVDVLVVAEGAHSRTSQVLLGQQRVSVLPEIPLITAICRPPPHPQPSCGGGRRLQFACDLYHGMIFSLNSLVRGEFLFNPYRKIASALNLTTPHQNSLSCMLSQQETEEMSRIFAECTNAQCALSAATVLNAPAEQLSFLEARCVKADRAKTSYLESRITEAFYSAFTLNLIRSVLRGEKGVSLKPIPWCPIDHVIMGTLAADIADACSGMLGGTVYLLAGDTVATVDAITGDGCNIAIQEIKRFNSLISQLSYGCEINLSEYNTSYAKVILQGHVDSLKMRQFFRPDGVAHSRCATFCKAAKSSCGSYLSSLSNGISRCRRRHPDQSEESSQDRFCESDDDSEYFDASDTLVVND